MRIILLLIAAVSNTGYSANSGAPSNFINTPVIQAFTACAAGSDHSSNTASDACTIGAPMTATTCKYLSFQCKWASLTGSVDGTVSLEVSNDIGVTWTAKSTATFTLSGASGNAEVSITNATEAYYRLVYAHTSISGGTISCYVAAKP